MELIQNFLMDIGLFIVVSVLVLFALSLVGIPGYLKVRRAEKKEKERKTHKYAKRQARKEGRRK